jgi:hypothetical protein
MEAAAMEKANKTADNLTDIGKSLKLKQSLKNKRGRPPKSKYIIIIIFCNS